MRKWIAKYTDNCHQCRRYKPSRHLPYGELKPLEPPKRPFADITMDFIVKLPILGKGFDSILVVVDRLTKYAKFIPFKESYKAPEFADTFLQEITFEFGFQDSILTDQGPTFKAQFWQLLQEKMGTKLKYTTPYHP